jgi:hypothetical protein
MRSAHVDLGWRSVGGGSEQWEDGKIESIKPLTAEYNEAELVPYVVSPPEPSAKSEPKSTS